MSAVPTGPPIVINTTTISTNVTVQWEPVKCIHRNGNITSYSVRVIRNGEIVKNVSVSGYIGNVTISELSPSTEYNISVAAVNSNGIGAYSDDTPVTTEGKVFRFASTQIFDQLAHYRWCLPHAIARV